MATAVVILLSDEGQMMVGEVDPGMVPSEELQPVETFEDGVQAAETLLLGDAPPPEVEEDAFNESMNGGMGGGEMMDEEA